MNRHIGQGLGSSQTELLCLLPVESGHITFLEHPCVHRPGSFTELRCLKFLLEFHYINMLDQITQSPGPILSLEVARSG